jgi:hypothetical protein
MSWGLLSRGRTCAADFVDTSLDRQPIERVDRQCCEEFNAVFEGHIRLAERPALLTVGALDTSNASARMLLAEFPVQRKRKL